MEKRVINDESSKSKRICSRCQANLALDLPDFDLCISCMHEDNAKLCPKCQKKGIISMSGICELCEFKRICN